MENPTQTPAFQTTLAVARKAVESLNAAGYENPAEELANLIKDAESQQFTIGIVGEAKRGKSTLINALLGRKDDAIAPMDRFPATNVISVFQYADTESAKVIYAANPEQQHDIAFSRVREYVCEEFNPDNTKGVKAVAVAGPFPSLVPGVNLVDTPGANNSRSNLHDTVLMEFLPTADALIFLVTADSPLTQSELTLLRHVRKQDVRKILFVVNKRDKVDADELGEALDHNRKVLAAAGFADAPIFTISAKAHYLTQTDEGTRQLLDALTFMIRRDRIEIMTRRLRERISSLLKASELEMKNELVASKKTFAELETEREELALFKGKVNNDRAAFESRFRAQWNTAHNDFMDGLKPACRALQADYAQVIQNTPDSRIGELAKIIHTDIAAKVSETLRPKMDYLESARAEALRHLEADFRSFCLAAMPEMAPVATGKSDFENVTKVVGAGLPTALGAIGVAMLPGLVGTVICHSANGIIMGTLANLGGAALMTALSPVALIGAPLLFAFAGYKVWNAFNALKVAERNQLTTASDKLLDDAFTSIHEQARTMRDSGEGILKAFHERLNAKLTETDTRLATLQRKRPDPNRLLALESCVAQVDAALGELK